jgi:hypothetical protein
MYRIPVIFESHTDATWVGKSALLVNFKTVVDEERRGGGE